MLHRQRDHSPASLQPDAEQRLPWVTVAPGAPYFLTEEGRPFTPIGQNDSVAWLELAPLYRRADVAQVERHLAWLAASGVTVLRLMMECAQSRHRYLERPPGRFVPAMVQLWDDLFAMCERHGLRILLTPYDTFWMWLRWQHHPYAAHGERSRLLLCSRLRQAIKARLTFAVERWGGSGVLFAWDLWNEIHYQHAEGGVDGWHDFIADLSGHVRALELKMYGRTHPQTVSVFGPELDWRPDLAIAAPIFRHPDLDFASIHIYREGTIDDPKDTVAPAIDMGRIVQRCIAEMPAGRPFLDSEHGPIHAFKDKHITLPAAFDDEMFRHMQWAHFASGGAGGGMRWPNRHPHCLTPGMRRAQALLGAFTPAIDWATFRRRNLSADVKVETPGLEVFACGDDRQALVWLLRTDTLRGDGTLDPRAAPVAALLTVPGLRTGACTIEFWDTASGRLATAEGRVDDGQLKLQTVPFARDLALAIRSLG